MLSSANGEAFRRRHLRRRRQRRRRRGDRALIRAASRSLAALLALPSLAIPVARGAPPAPLPEAPEFKRESLRVAGRISSVHAEDLDGDGRRDLVVLFAVGAPPSVARKIALFHDRGSGYRAAPDQVLPAPAGASFVDAVDLDGDRRAELLFADAQGLGFLVAGEKGYGETRRLVDVQGLALLPDEEELAWLDVARDWDGDGKPEILLPLVDRIAVIAPAADGSWARTGELALPPRASYVARADAYEPRARNYTLRALLTVPELHVADWDGDGRRDLIAVLDDDVTVFAGRKEGGFAREPAARVHLGARTDAEAVRGNAPLQTSVVDLDGDGIADLAVDKVVGGLGTMHAQVGLYYGRRGGGWARPTQVIAREGYAGALQFADLDGDGRPELLLCHTPFGFGEAVQVVLRRRLFVSFGVHENRGARGFADKPTIDLPIDFPVGWEAGAELEGPFPTLAGDFNGDGRPDLAGPLHASPTDGAFAVWLGGGKSLLDEYPRAIAHAPLTHYWKVLDLDGDKRADVVLFYRFHADRQGEIEVLRNTGRGW